MGTSAGQPGTVNPPGVGAFGQPAGAGEPRPSASEQPGGQPGGTGDPSQQGSGGAPTGSEFDRGQLNPILRDMNPGQINELFQALLIRQGGQPEQQSAPARPAQPELPEINLREAMDPQHENYDPEGAMRWFVQKNYGQLMTDINQRSIKGLYGNFRSQIHDFGDYEADIDKALAQRDPSTLSEKDVFGTYLAMKGMRQLQRERQERAQQSGRTTTPPSTPRPDEQQGDVQLDATETEMARIMFPNAPDPVARYKEYKKKSQGGSYEMTVPLGDGKRS